MPLPSGHPGVYIQEVPSTPTVQGAPTAIPLFMGVTETGDVGSQRLITSWASYSRYFGGLVWGAYTGWAVYEFFQEGGSSCYVVSLQSNDPNNPLPPVAVGGLTFTPTTYGAWAQFIYVAIRDAVPPQQGQQGPSNLFTVSVMANQNLLDAAIEGGDVDATLAAQLINAYIDNNTLLAEPDPTAGEPGPWVTLESFGSFTVASLSTGSGNGATGPAPIQTYINARSVFIRVTNVDSTQGRPPNNFGPEGQSLQPFTATSVALDYDSAGAYLTTNQDVSLLSTPDLVLDTTTQKTTANTLLGTCETSNAFYVIDPPFYPPASKTFDPIQAILNFKTGTPASDTDPALASEYGALYFPWVLVLNQITNVNVPVPPSGAVLGRYANTDYNVGVHKSPAGTRDGVMRTVAGMTTSVSESDQDNLNPNGINALRTLSGYGNAIYGARTLAVASDYTYVAIRRFVSFVERSLRNNLQWLVFEPNTPDLWMMAKSEVTAFLTAQWQRGALFGGTAAEAFYVVCDGTNNPPEDRALGVLCIDVGLSVVYPNEFVLIRITQKSSSPNA